MNTVFEDGAEREPEPITADVTGAMRRGLSYDPTDMLGERVSVEHVGLPSPDAHAVAAALNSLASSGERSLAIHGRWDVTPGYLRQLADRLNEPRRPPLARIAEPNPDKPTQPDALTRLEILTGQLKYLDQPGLATLAERVRDLRDTNAVADEFDPPPMLRSELVRLLNYRRDTFAYVYVPVEGRRPVRLGISAVHYVSAHDHTAIRTAPWFLEPGRSPHAAEQRAVIDQVVAGLGADERLLTHVAGQSAELVQAFVDLVGAARDVWLDPPASHEGTTEPGEVDR